MRERLLAPSSTPTPALTLPLIALWLLCLLLPAELAWGQIAVSGELTHEFFVEPGSTYEGEILVTNTSDTLTRVSIEQTDYAFYADGSNLYEEPGTNPRSNSEWLRFALPSRLTIDPGESITIRYWIDIPHDSSLTGTYWSMILVAPRPSEATASEEPASIGVQAIFQYGIQIVTHIGDSGTREIRIDNVQLLSTEEGVVLQIDLQNIGERWVRPDVWAELYSQTGEMVGRFESARMRIYPTTSVRHRILLPVNPGTYQALVVFDNLDEYVWGAQYTLEIE